MPEPLNDQFSKEWVAAVPAVRAYCRVVTGNGHDAEDLVQTVAMRAWLGFGSFRGDSAFATWVLAIARREAASAASRAVRRARPMAELPERAIVSPPDEPGSDLPTGALAGALADALRAGAISAAQHDALFTRLVRPGETWTQIGDRLGVTKEAAAVAHLRGIDRMRVYLFLHRQDLLGGSEAVRAAFERARASRTPLLTPAEAQVFQRMVVNGRVDYRGGSWVLNLRSACRAVARHLSSTDR
jgi:RNA polymerase sigma factor (sigma-70 family)